MSGATLGITAALAAASSGGGWVGALAPAWAHTHAVLLIPVIPLLAAAVAAFGLGGRAAWALALGATAASFAASLLVVDQVETYGVVSYALGGWAPPLGIEYRADALNAPILLLISAIGVAAAAFAPATVAREVAAERRGLFFAAFLVCFAGLLGVVVTGDAFNLFVFLEISSLSTYVLVAMGARQDRRALTAAYNYLVLGTIGATFFVIGVGFLYIATGTLNLADMARLLPPLTDTTTVRAGYAFIFIGLGLKAAMFPLHTWLPNAYAFAPSFITVFLAATATKAAIYALIRFLFTVFDSRYAFEEVTLAWLLAPLAAAGMILASLQACVQTDAKRILAYSSVAQVGYMLLGVATATTAGVAAGLLHLFNHALMKGALFMALGAVALRLNARTVSDLAGLGRRMPVTFAALTIGGLSLMGVPLTAGFISKLYLFAAVIDRGWWWAVAVIAVSSVLAFFYVGRILEAAYLRAPSAAAEAAGAARTPVTLLIPLLVLAGANIWFGVDAGWLESLARGAAEAVLAEPLLVEPLAAEGGGS